MAVSARTRIKPIHYILICCLLGLAGCSQSDSLSNFSKRKYLKKAPKQRAVEQVYKEDPTIYAATELSISDYVLEEIPAIDEEPVVEYYTTDSLEYNDTIITNSGEIIIGKVTSVKGPNILYHIDQKNGKKVRRHISVSKVKYCSKYNAEKESVSTIHKGVNRMALLSFLCVIPFASLVFPILLAPILGFIGLNQIKKDPENNTGKGFAYFGIVGGFILFALTIAFILFALAFGGVI